MVPVSLGMPFLLALFVAALTVALATVRTGRRDD
jgi:hypothetical protein